jgi:hypothetical protein
VILGIAQRVAADDYTGSLGEEVLAAQSRNEDRSNRSDGEAPAMAEERSSWYSAQRKAKVALAGTVTGQRSSGG